ncbi:lipoprotein [Candidatus Odyssella thessalonicensis]|uniref:lipoprotein n=1 Tax=Candidatus Odyssella thessalonicensis TaxID=84647 RepID=UPI003CCA89BE
MNSRNLRVFLRLFLIAIIGGALSACGRKGDPEPINKTDYPRPYPSQQLDCTI